jgi:uroporphyrinogen decarboxylase
MPEPRPALTSRERLLVALDGGEPDRVPRALSFYRVEIEAIAPPGAGLDGLVDVDFVRFPPSPEESDLERRAMPFPGDTRLGHPSQVRNYSRWRYHPESQEARNPLARARSLEDLRRFPFPDLRGPYVAEGLAGQVADLHGRGLAAGGNLPHLGGELFEAAWRLRGLESFLTDLVERPDWAHYLLDRLAALARRNAEALARAGVDVLALDDDVGMPGRMMISPPMWREFFAPRLAAIIRAARAIKSDLRVLYHSDGHIEPILGDLVDMGVEAVNPVQPEHMDAARIRRRFGKHLALWGTVGRQTTFAFATPAEIRAEVEERVVSLGRAGLVLCPAYDIDEPDVPWENVAAFLQAAGDFGQCRPGSLP